MGGDWYWNLDEGQKEELSAIIEDHVSKLPISITIQYPEVSVGLVHAQPPDDWSDFETGKADYVMTVWGRHRVRSGNMSMVSSIDMAFVGHTVTEWLNKLGNVYLIDSGAGYEHGQLTLVMLPSKTSEPFFMQNLNKHIERW